MKAIPAEWNINIIGAWNVAIFAPAWVKDKLFQLPAEQTIQVEMLLDMVSPPRFTSNQGVRVVPDERQLQLSCTENNYENLDKAKQLAIRALTELPVTPVRAVGINVRYKLEDPPSEFLSLLNSAIDDPLQDRKWKIVGRSFGRSLTWGEGVLNLAVNFDDANGATVICNFHIESGERQQLLQWLARPTAEFRAQVDQLLTQILRLPLTEAEE